MSQPRSGGAAEKADVSMIRRVKAFEQFLPSFAGIAEKVWFNPKEFNAERFINTAIQCMLRNPDLANCETLSVIGALRACAELSLYPDDLRGHAYLVPRHDKNLPQGVKRCTLIVGYLGYVYLFRRTGMAANKAVTAERVFDGDTLEIEKGLTPKLYHKPLLEPTEDRDMLLVYAILHYKDGGYDFDYMLTDDLKKLEAVYVEAKGDYSPWHRSDLSRSWMEKKSVIRQVMKLSPALDPALSAAVSWDEKGDAGVSQGLEAMVDKKLAGLARDLIDARRQSVVDVPALPDGASGSKLDTFMRERQRIDAENANGGKAPPPAEGVAAVEMPDGAKMDAATGEVLQETEAKPEPAPEPAPEPEKKTKSGKKKTSKKGTATATATKQAPEQAQLPGDDAPPVGEYTEPPKEPGAPQKPSEDVKAGSDEDPWERMYS